MVKKLKRLCKVVGYSVSSTMHFTPDEMQELKRICDCFNCTEREFTELAVEYLKNAVLCFMDKNPEVKDAELRWISIECGDEDDGHIVIEDPYC